MIRFQPISQLSALAGDLPPSLALRFFDVVHRVQVLLKHRSSNDIEAGARVLARIGRHPKFRNQDFDDFGTPGTWVPLPNGESVECWPVSTRISQLRYNIDKVDLRDFAEFEDGKWFELFAILACICIEQAKHVDALRGKRDPILGHPISDDNVDEMLEELVLEGREAISVAESLQSEVRKLRARGSRAHDKRRPYKMCVIEMMRAMYPTLSASEAARHIFLELTRSKRLRYDSKTRQVFFEGIQVGQNEDPEYQIKKWVLEARKKAK